MPFSRRVKIAWTTYLSVAAPALLALTTLLGSASQAEHAPRLSLMPQAATLAWSTRAQFRCAGALTGELAIDAHGDVYVADHEGVLYALDERGQLRWKRPLSSPAHGGVTLKEGAIYVGTDAGMLWSFDSLGTLRFKRSLGAPIDSRPAVSSSGQVWVSAGRTLFALTDAGDVQVRFRTWGKLFASPVLDTEGRPYVGAQDGNFYAVASDGGERFRVHARAAINAEAVLDADGNSFFADEQGDVHAVDVWGEERWLRKLGSPVRAALALGPQGELLVTTAGPHVRWVAFDRQDGRILAERTLALTDGGESDRVSGVAVDAKRRIWLWGPDDHVWVTVGVGTAPRPLSMQTQLSARPLISPQGRVILAERAGDVFFGSLGVIAPLLPSGSSL